MPCKAVQGSAFNASNPPLSAISKEVPPVVPFTVHEQNQSLLALLHIGCWAAPRPPRVASFFIRVRDVTDKYKWQTHETESAANQGS